MFLFCSFLLVICTGLALQDRCVREREDAVCEIHGGKGKPRAGNLMGSFASTGSSCAGEWKLPCKGRAEEEGWAVPPPPAAVRGDAAAAAGAASLLLPRSASVPALSEQPQCAGAQCSLHSSSDWRSRRFPCLLLSGSQVRERSQLLFPSAARGWLPAWSAAPGHPSGGSHPATQTRSD